MRLIEMIKMIAETAFLPIQILALLGMVALAFGRPVRAELSDRRRLQLLAIFTLFCLSWRMGITSVNSHRYIIIWAALATVWGAFGIHWVLEATRVILRCDTHPGLGRWGTSILLVLLFSGLLLKSMRTDGKARQFEQLRSLIAANVQQMREPVLLTTEDGSRRMAYYTGVKSVDLREKLLSRDFLIALWEGTDLFWVCSARSETRLQTLAAQYLPAAKPEFLASVGKWRVYRLLRETPGYGIPAEQAFVQNDSTESPPWLYEGFEQEGSESTVFGSVLPTSPSMLRTESGTAALVGAHSAEFPGGEGLYSLRKPLNCAARYRCTFRIRADENFSMEVGRRDGNDYFWSGNGMGGRSYELSYVFPAQGTEGKYNLMFSFSGSSCRLDELTIIQLNEP